MAEANQNADVIRLKNKLVNAEVQLSRSALAAQMGMQFGQKRDLYAALGYKRTLIFDDYDARYDRGGIAKRVVDAPASATWANPPKVFEDDDPNKSTRFEREFDQVALQTKLWHYLERADRLSGIGEFGVLLIGVNDGKATKNTMGTLRGPKDVMYLSAFSQRYVTVEEIEDDASNERFGHPRLYKIKMNAGLTGVTSRDVMVHASRVVHLSDTLKDNEIFGEPRLKAVYNLFDDLEKVTGGSAEAFWHIANRGFAVNIDKEASFDPSGEEATQLEEEIDAFVHNQRRWIRAQGMEITNLGSAAADPSKNFEMLVQQISGTTGIPTRILLGSERGNLASTQDRMNWNERINERQVRYAEPCVLRVLVDRLIKYGAIKPPASRKGYQAEWPTLEALSAEEQARVEFNRSQAVRNFGSKEALSILTVGEARKTVRLPAVKPEETQVEEASVQPSLFEPDPMLMPPDPEEE